MSADASSAPPPATDEIIERCLNGDQAAWESIVRMYRRKVFNVAYKFVGRHDQAEDLTQDVFLKLYKSLDTFDRRANFQTWLISVSRNLCIDHYRSVRKERETINRDVDASTLMPVSRDRSAYAQLELRDRVAVGGVDGPGRYRGGAAVLRRDDASDPWSPLGRARAGRAHIGFARRLRRSRFRALAAPGLAAGPGHRSHT